ncbi:C_GCAxxG_C_C family protein [Desulfovibrio sp. X2]|uniref:DVU_1555 family C-GCAxxG-C-C protein n=1 Tax=Desulfovibrio sp. X2 TaxID=941449 RepID=UPI0003587D51|nr:DV_1555 family C-GCAxxG-C-C protein [Desulfovibrio sp. X2]EPR41252.1 C_GCAxxG_C_C family protein [Desulfovibrio sp. X2]
MSEYMMDILPLAGRGYCCSQILGLLALGAQGRENADLIRALGGLCHGMGQCGATCGVLTGGACVLSLYLGKGADDETASERADLAVSEFYDWFGERTAQYGGMTCADILGECPEGKPDVSRCGELLSDAWGQLLAILAEQGVDPSVPREE